MIQYFATAESHAPERQALHIAPDYSRGDSQRCRETDNCSDREEVARGRGRPILARTIARRPHAAVIGHAPADRMTIGVPPHRRASR